MSNVNIPLIDDVVETDIKPESTLNWKNSLKTMWPRWRPNNKVKICIIAASWGFLTGVERAIILPTLWLYISNSFSREAAMQYYGISLASFNLAVLFVSPVYGYFAMKGMRVKVLVIFSNQLEIVGNIIYLLASQPYFVMIGRFIAGLGAGSEVPLYAEIVRITTPEERTAFFITLQMTKMLGVIIGPACTIFMHPFKFTNGGFHVDVYNGPGLFMAILWAIHTIATLFMYPVLSRYSTSSVENHGRNTSPIVYSKLELPHDEQDVDEKSRRGDYISSGDVAHQNTWFDTFSLRPLYPYFKYDTMTLLLGIFSGYTCLMALEVILPPVATTYFHWSDLETSYVYLVSGIFIIIVYLILRSISSCVSDLSILIFGCIALMSSYTLLSITFVYIDDERIKLFVPLVLSGITFHVIGIACCVTAESLYTKTLPEVDMDHSQAVVRTVMNVAVFVGPFLGGTLQGHPAVVFGIMFTSMAMPTVLLLIRYRLF